MHTSNKTGVFSKLNDYSMENFDIRTNSILSNKISICKKLRLLFKKANIFQQQQRKLNTIIQRNKIQSYIMNAEVDQTSKYKTPINFTQNMMFNNSNIQYGAFKNEEDQESIDTNLENLQLHIRNDGQIQNEQVKQDIQDEKEQYSSQSLNKSEPISSKIQNQEIKRDSESVQTNDINKLNSQFYLQSDKEHMSLIDSGNVIINQYGHKRGLLYNTPQNFHNNKMYGYNIPMKVKTEGSYDDTFQDTQISLDTAQSPANFNLAQLNSKSFYINSIMKKNTNELIEDQKKMAQIIASSNNIDQAVKQIQGQQKKQKKQTNQLSLDLINIQKGELDLQSLDLKNKFQIQKIKQFKIEPIKSKTDRKNLSRKQKHLETQQYIEDNQQGIKIQTIGNLQKKKQIVLSTFIPSQESQSTKARSGSTVKNIQIKTLQTLSNHVSPQNELVKQGEKVFNFGNRSSGGGSNRLPDLNNKSIPFTQQLQQNKNPKSKSQSILNNILMNTQQAQTQVFNQLQQQQSSNNQRQGSYNQIGMLNSLSQRINNKQNYILIGQKNQKFTQGYSTSTNFKTSSNDMMFSTTSNSQRNQQKRKNMLNNFINNRDTDENDTDDFIEEDEVEQKNKLIQEDLYGQKYVMRVDGVLQPSDYDLRSQQKLNSKQISSNSQPTYQSDIKPGSGILTQVLKPVESISFYYQNKNPNQVDLISERTNLNAPLDPLFKQNSFESKWKIEKSDIVDMEASRMISSASSLSPNKVLNRKLSSQQLSPNSFFPQPSIKLSNENIPHINQVDNMYSSVSNEQNIGQIFHSQNINLGDSQQQNLQTQNYIQINSNKEINVHENKLQNDTSQILIIQRKLTEQSQKQTSPITQEYELKEMNRSASSSISLQISQLTIDNIKGDREVFDKKKQIKLNQFQQQLSENQTFQKQSDQNSKPWQSQKEIIPSTSKKQIFQQTQEKQIESKKSQKQFSQQSSENLIPSKGSSQQIISQSSQKQIPSQNQKTQILLSNKNAPIIFEKEEQKIQQTESPRELNTSIDNKLQLNKKSKLKQTTLEFQLNNQSSNSSSSSKQSQNLNNKSDNYEGNVEQFNIEQDIENQQELLNKQFSVSNTHKQQMKENAEIIIEGPMLLQNNTNQDKNQLQLQNSKIQNDNLMKLEESYNQEIQTKSMTTVQEKSELTSMISIPTQEKIEMKKQKYDENESFIRKKNVSLQAEQSPQSKMARKNQKVSSLNEVSLQKLDSKTKSNINQSIQISEQKLSQSLDQQSLKKINSDKKIENLKNKRQNSNNDINDEIMQKEERSITKKRSISELDRKSLKKINDQSSLNTEIPNINQLIGEKKPTSHHFSMDETYIQTDQQLKTKRETFKGKSDDELQINVVPPDNSTPQSNRNISTKFNFSDLSQSLENQNSTNSPTQRIKSVFGAKNPNNKQNNTNIDVNVNDINNNHNNNEQLIKSNSLNNDNDLNASNKNENVNNNKNDGHQENNRVSIIVLQNNNQSSLSSVNTNTIISNSENQIQVQSSLLHGRSSSSSTFNQDDLSQNESKKTIKSENNVISFQKQQKKQESGNNKFDKQKRQSEQQLYIQNHYQKLTRSVKSNEDTLNKYDEDLIEKSQREDSQSNTTKHSGKQMQDLGNFQQEVDSSFLSNQKEKLSKKQLVEQKINQQNSQHQSFDELPQKYEKTSFDISSNRRSSILTPQQIKQIKKESRFFGKTSIYNKKSDSDEPILFNIYGQESETLVDDLSGYCVFNQQDQIKSSSFKDEDKSITHLLLNENEPPPQITQYQQHQLNFKKLIHQIDHSKQNPYSEPFEKPKGDSIFQKNVKTLFRKINQYFKTKYHFDSTNQIELNRNGYRTQQQDNQTPKLTKQAQSQPQDNKQNNTKGTGFSVSEKQIPNNKKSIQSDLAQSDEIEYEEGKQLKENHELKKSDIEQLHQKLLKRDKKNIIDKLIIKSDDNSKEFKQTNIFNLN